MYKTFDDMGIKVSLRQSYPGDFWRDQMGDIWEVDEFSQRCWRKDVNKIDPLNSPFGFKLF